MFLPDRVQLNNTGMSSSTVTPTLSTLCHCCPCVCLLTVTDVPREETKPAAVLLVSGIDDCDTVVVTVDDGNRDAIYFPKVSNPSFSEGNTVSSGGDQDDDDFDATYTVFQKKNIHSYYDTYGVMAESTVCFRVASFSVESLC